MDKASKAAAHGGQGSMRSFHLGLNDLRVYTENCSGITHGFVLRDSSWLTQETICGVRDQARLHYVQGKFPPSCTMALVLVLLVGANLVPSLSWAFTPVGFSRFKCFSRPSRGGPDKVELTQVLPILS